MKMAKASKADMEMAMKLCSALEAIDRRAFPEGTEGDDDPEDFDWYDDEHCGRVLRHIARTLQDGSIGRVIWGMYVLMDPDNKIVDPDADTLEQHPELAAQEADADRYRWMRDRLLGADFDWQGTQALVFELPQGARVSASCDATIDAAMAMPANAK